VLSCVAPRARAPLYAAGCPSPSIGNASALVVGSGGDGGGVDYGSGDFGSGGGAFDYGSGSGDDGAAAGDWWRDYEGGDDLTTQFFSGAIVPVATNLVSAAGCATGAVDATPLVLSAPLEVSLNGQQYTTSGVVFTQFAPVRILGVDPPQGPSLGDSTVRVTFNATGQEKPFEGLRCRFGGAEATLPAQHADGWALCVAPQAHRAKAQALSYAIDFDGELASPVVKSTDHNGGLGGRSLSYVMGTPPSTRPEANGAVRLELFGDAHVHGGVLHLTDLVADGGGVNTVDALENTMIDEDVEWDRGGYAPFRPLPCPPVAHACIPNPSTLSLSHPPPSPLLPRQASARGRSRPTARAASPSTRSSRR